MADFRTEVADRLRAAPSNGPLTDSARAFMHQSIATRYSYNYAWMGRPIIQYPQDVMALQELVWQVRPDIIVETGIAHGGSLMLSASLLAMLDLCDAAQAGRSLDPTLPDRRVIGIDIDIRPANRAAIEAHPLHHRITMIEGSSIDPQVVCQVRDLIAPGRRVLVCLDSNHTHDHVLAELAAYAPMVSADSYCIVFDTIIECLPQDLSFDRPWGPGNNPATAVQAWLPDNPEFQVDASLDAKLLVSVAPGGFLRRVTG